MNTKLLTYALDRNYFVNNGIIYEIKDYKSTTDEHAVHIGGGINEVKIPKIEASKTIDGVEDKKTYYLDSLVEDGDKLIINANVSPFLKTNHIFSPEDEEDFFEYYKKMCEAAIGQKLVSLNNYSYDYIVENKVNLSIPDFMIGYPIDGSENYDGYTLKFYNGNNNPTTVEPIILTEEVYDNLKDEIIQQKILEAARKEANKYNYKVNSVDAEKI